MGGGQLVMDHQYGLDFAVIDGCMDCLPSHTTQDIEKTKRRLA